MPRVVDSDFHDERIGHEEPPRVVRALRDAREHLEEGLADGLDAFRVQPRLVFEFFKEPLKSVLRADGFEVWELEFTLIERERRIECALVEHFLDPLRGNL